MKIATWMLGGFVFGMVTAIAVDTAGLHELSLSAARTVFFVVFIMGVIDAFFRNVYHGLQYRITDRALVMVKPFYGIEAVGRSLGSEEKPFGEKLEFIEWSEIKEIKEHESSLLSTLKDDKGAVLIHVLPLKSIEPAPANKPKSAEDKEMLKYIIQKAREVKRVSANG